MTQPLVYEDCSGTIKFTTDFRSTCTLNGKIYTSSDWSWEFDLFRGKNIENATPEDEIVQPKALENFKAILNMEKKVSDFYTEDGFLRSTEEPLFELAPYSFGYEYQHVRDVEPLTFGDSLIGYMFTPLTFGGDFPPSYTQRIGALYNRDLDLLILVKLSLPYAMYDNTYTYLMENGQKDKAGDFDYTYYTDHPEALVALIGQGFDEAAKNAPLQETYDAVTRALVSITTEEPTRSFPDVSFAHPLYDAIELVKARGLVAGYPDGSMKPDNLINRAEFLKILIGASAKEKIPGATSSCFKDVQKDAWYAPYVCYAKAKKIVEGYADGNFGPEKNINLAEALKIVAGAYDLDGTSMDNAWYSKYIQIGYDYGMLKRIMKEPGDLVTRAEMSEFIARMLTE